MKLDVSAIKDILELHFSGDLVYQPVHVTGDAALRPVAQLIPARQILQSLASLEPHSLTRQRSSLHLHGLLHHQPGRR